MEDSYIVIEEDNERKILREDPATREAYRELEQRYRHLTDPRPVQADWEALRQQFLRNRAAPSDRDDSNAGVPEDEIPDETAVAPIGRVSEVPGADASEETTPNAGPSANREASPKATSAMQEETAPEKPIEEQVRELIEAYKAQRPQTTPPDAPEVSEEPEAPESSVYQKDPTKTFQGEAHGIRYTVMNESDVEILEGPEADKFHSIGPVFVTPLEHAPEKGSLDSRDRSEKNGIPQTSVWRRYLPGIATAAAVAVLGLAWIYTIWN